MRTRNAVSLCRPAPSTVPAIGPILQRLQRATHGVSMRVRCRLRRLLGPYFIKAPLCRRFRLPCEVGSSYDFTKELNRLARATHGLKHIDCGMADTITCDCPRKSVVNHRKYMSRLTSDKNSGQQVLTRGIHNQDQRGWPELSKWQDLQQDRCRCSCRHLSKLGRQRHITFSICM
jgi:hypothetical protein